MNLCLHVFDCMRLTVISACAWVRLLLWASPTFDRHTAQLLPVPHSAGLPPKNSIQTRGYFWTQCLHHDNWPTLRPWSLPSTALQHSSLDIIAWSTLYMSEMLCQCVHCLIPQHTVVCGCLTWYLRNTRKAAAAAVSWFGRWNPMSSYEDLWLRDLSFCSKDQSTADRGQMKTN